MKNYKKGFLGLCILSVITFVMADTVQDDRIRVTTFADENGENSSACSLREALKAAEINQAYGGCSPGKVRNSMTDVIMLEKGEYVLTRPLVPASQIIIYGVDGKDWSKKDAITGDYPASATPASVIKGNHSFSLFDTSLGNGSVSLNDLILTEGGGQLGGAIHAGVPIVLNNVHVKNSKATAKGGAIYLTGSRSALDVQKAIFENNQAPQGAVLAMTCVDNLKFTERTINWASSSILNNGNAETKSVIEFCGKPEVEFINNTITKNTASSTLGSIIKFTGDSLPNSSSSSILSDSSSLSAEQNTIINNAAYSTFLYDSIGAKGFFSNIIGYNQQGYSCRHLMGKLKEEDKDATSVSFASNALNSDDKAVDYCDFPYKASSTSTTTTSNDTVDLSKIRQQDVLLPLQTQSQFSPLPVYFLKNIANNPLVGSNNASSCEDGDQLGRNRGIESSILGTKQDKCDLGAIEQSQLSVIDLKLSNTSLVDLMKGFETERNFFDNLVNAKSTPAEFLPYYKIRYQQEVDKIENYPKTFKYRVTYFDVFASSQPQEIINSSGAAELQHLSKDLYSVTTESLASGPDVISTNTPEQIPTIKDPNLKCEWDETIEKVLMYRTDGLTSQAGDYEYCKYTITLKSNPTIKATGLLQTTFSNINPVAVNDTYTLKWGTDQRVRLDLLANDHDNGDGKPTDPFYPSGKKIFYTDPSGVSAPIKIGKIDSNLHFEAEYEAPCPDETGDICYGGEMYIQPKNSFNKFNYSFTYTVFDVDAGVSNAATVSLINTATTTDDTRGKDEKPNYNTGKPSSGSMGIMSLIGLIGLVGLRRKYSK